MPKYRMPKSKLSTPQENIKNWLGTYHWVYSLILWFGLIFILLMSVQASDYFLKPYTEFGDLAANALQIENAKQLHEIYGHYSRWQFHHPGPSFFYLYALGELILFDGLHIMPSIHNAHLLTSLFIQTGLFTISLFLVARQLNKTAFFIPLALLVATFHFGMADKAFYSIWPPYTLLFPFLCFLVGCASLSIGKGTTLPLVCFVGGLLVHNYIAQPLFVGPLFVWSYASLLWKLKRTKNTPFLIGAIKEFPKEHVIAGIILIIFLIPLGIDMTYGTDSNFHQIMLHLQSTSGDRKTLFQSVSFLLSFFVYEKNPEVYANISGSPHLIFFQNQLWVFVTWLFVFCAPILYWYRKRKESRSVPIMKAMYLTTIISLILSLIWGILQNESMLRFSGYFYYAILFIPLIIAVATVSDLFQPFGSQARAIILSAISLSIFTWVFAQQSIVAAHWNSKPLHNILTNDPNTPSIKYLAFEHENWPLAISTALELQREGYDFRVASHWGFMFGKQKVLTSDDLNREDMAVWRILPTKMLPPSGLPLTKQAGVLRTDAQPFSLDPENSTITFGLNGNSHLYEGFGWGGSGQFGVWSAADETTLIFVPLPASKDVCMTIKGHPYLAAGQYDHQMVGVYYNQANLGTLNWYEDQSNTVMIARDLWNSQNKSDLHFKFPRATSPWSVEDSRDRRQLGVEFSQINMAYCTP